MNKKILLFLVLLYNIFLFANENDIAKFYIKKAFDFYNQNAYKSSEEFLERAFQFATDIPEYFYLKNLLLEDSRVNASKKQYNADRIVEFIKNRFFIDEYYLYSNAVAAYEKIASYLKAYNAYQNLLSSEKRTPEDFKKFIRMLFYSAVKEHFFVIPDAVILAKKSFSSLDFDYFLLKYKILDKKISASEFVTEINRLKSNNYEKAKVLLLEVLFFNERVNLEDLLKQYMDLTGRVEIDKFLRREILFEFFVKSNFLRNDYIGLLLKEWDKYLQDDYKTVDILRIERVSNVLKRDLSLFNRFLFFNGVRYKDDNIDGMWEELFEYRNGVLVKHIVDIDQDNNFERVYVYTEKGILKEYSFYKKPDEYSIVYFNTNDTSVVKLNEYINNLLIKTITLKPSTFFVKKNELFYLKEPDYKKNISTVEEFSREFYKVTKYEGGQRVYSLVDKNFNNIFEERIVFNNDMIAKRFRDTNENGIFETVEEFNNGKLIKLFQMLDERDNSYGYLEIYFDNFTRKQWDNNLDSIFEIEIDEFFDGKKLKKIDIDFDGVYDFVYQYKNGQLLTIFDLKKRKEVTIKNINVKDVYKKVERGITYNIITSKIRENIELPDSINVLDKRNINGFFSYKNEKYNFKNGLLESPFFKFRLFYIEDKLYLYEL